MENKLYTNELTRRDLAHEKFGLPDLIAILILTITLPFFVLVLINPSNYSRSLLLEMVDIPFLDFDSFE